MARGGKLLSSGINKPCAWRTGHKAKRSTKSNKDRRIATSSPRSENVPHHIIDEQNRSPIACGARKDRLLRNRYVRVKCLTTQDEQDTNTAGTNRLSCLKETFHFLGVRR